LDRPSIPQGDSVVPQGDSGTAQEEENGDDALEMLRDVRLFHARVIEAVEAAVETLVGDIAAEVLGRELALAPADIESIVDRTLERFAAEEPVRVRVHAGEAERLRCTLPVVIDPQLRPGDAAIDVRTGSIDASLGVRLESAIRALSAA
jgi:flagellar biosynthesis/type III secretory pathway protein FliH